MTFRPDWMVTAGILFLAIALSGLIAFAVYFGTSQEKPDHGIGSALKDFLATPIFIAFLLGLAVSIAISIFEIPGADAFVGLFSGFFSTINHFVELLVRIAVGLILHPLKAKTFLPILALVICIKMILQPALVLAGTYAVGVPMLERQILFTEAAIPSGAIAAVLTGRYGCDGPLAAALVIATYLVSLVTIPCAMMIFG
ncbi:MAG: AEC family transporter [Methanoculleus sp.]|nr:AEC family transporter [Methanoculleus sp.]